jgi:hypothetical protein
MAIPLWCVDRCKNRSLIDAADRPAKPRQHHPLPIERVDADALTKNILNSRVRGRVAPCAVVLHLALVHDDDVVGVQGHEALLKLFYLALNNISKKWTMPLRDWKAALTRFTIQFEGRTDRKSNRMGAIMTHVLGITGLPPGPA